MALLLDQQLVGEVAEYCPREFLKYYQCLGQGDAEACFGEQKKLSTCVKKSSPTFIKILERCQPLMAAYEDCIRQNPDYRTKCFDRLKEMRACTSSVGLEMMRDNSSIV